MVQRDSNLSAPNGKLSQFARSMAPPIPVRTAKFSGALTPNASVTATPNVSKRSPLNSCGSACVPADEEKKTEENFGASGDDSQRQDQSCRQIPIEGVGVFQEP